MNYLPLLFARVPVTDADGLPTDFYGLDRDQRFVVILVVVSCVTLLLLVIGCVAAACWNAVRQREVEAELKQDMLDRGMNAEEIEQVVKAQPKEGLDHWMEVWAKKKR